MASLPREKFVGTCKRTSILDYFEQKAFAAAGDARMTSMRKGASGFRAVSPRGHSPWRVRVGLAGRMHLARCEVVWSHGRLLRKGEDSTYSEDEIINSLYCTPCDT